jgi:hypothetical protein
MTPGESEKFYYYCQNYITNQDFDAARLYRIEFLKTLADESYKITPDAWLEFQRFAHRLEDKPLSQATIGDLSLI